MTSEFRQVSSSPDLVGIEHVVEILGDRVRVELKRRR